MNVHWTEAAERDLIEIYEYIAKDSARYAQRMVDRITARSQQIALFPRSGAMVPLYERDDLREVFEGSYRIVYRIRSDQIDVITVIHGARLLPPLP